MDAFTETIRRKERPMIGEEVIAIWDDGIDGAELYEVQKLVRCKDCVYCNVQNTKYLYAICQRHGIEFKPFEDDIRTHGCTWGERKGE